MSEGDIKETMSTFIVEMEQDEDPRISILEAEKAAIEATLSDVSIIDNNGNSQIQ